MSVHELTSRDGKTTGFRVRWRPPGEANARSQTFRVEPGVTRAQAKKAAGSFDAERAQDQTQGRRGPQGGRIKLSTYATEHYLPYARHGEAYRRTHATVWNKWILPYLGDVEIGTLAADPETLDRWQAKLRGLGIGDAVNRKAIAILSAVFRRAESKGRIASNPCKGLERPPATRKRLARPMGPATIESIRAGLGPRDATLVSVLAYCGLRPGEALALTWADIRERTILVDKSIALGAEKGTKTGKLRAAELPITVRSDLTAWQKECGTEVGLIFPGFDGRPWSDAAFRNWRRRVFRPAVEALGLEGVRPYDLRHSCASLMLRAYGDDPMFVAGRMGHSLKMLSDVYAHEIAELRGQARVSMDDQITAARDTSVTHLTQKHAPSGTVRPQRSTRKA